MKFSTFKDKQRIFGVNFAVGGYWFISVHMGQWSLFIEVNHDC